MKFYCIVKNRNKKSIAKKLLKKNCVKKGVDFLLVESEKYDFSKDYQLSNSDLLYRVATDPKSVTVEKKLLNDKCVSVYSDYTNGINKTKHEFLIQEKKSLPIIKTIVDVPNDAKLLKKYVDYLNGFPVVIKATGGSHGRGIMKIDSWESLLSVSDFLNSEPLQLTCSDYIMREFIDHSEQARLVVLENKVIASKENRKNSDDFRLNKNIKESAKKYSSEIEKTAIRAVNSLGWRFGGVDILIGDNGKHYIAEVNLPCNFARTQLLTGIDIAGIMIDYLIKKANGKRVS